MDILFHEKSRKQKSIATGLLSLRSLNGDPLKLSSTSYNVYHSWESSQNMLGNQKKNK